MGLLIDAYNVLHCTHELPSRYAMISVTDLCRLIEQSRWADEPAAVVCDGVPKPNEGLYDGPVELVYSGGASDADSVIERRIEASDVPRALVVVSNDRRIIRAARRRRCRQMSSEQFLRLLITQRRPQATDPKPTAIGTTEQWLAEFDLDDQSADRIERELAEAEQTPAPPTPQRDPHENNPACEFDDAPAIGESEADYWLREFGFGDDESRDDDLE